MAKNAFSPRKAGALIDIIHIVLGIAVIVMAVLAIFDPENRKFLFPFIFLFASVINFATAWFYMRMFQRDRGKHISAWVYLITGFLIFVVFIISAVSLWGGR